jgi:hypothetical protein
MTELKIYIKPLTDKNAQLVTGGIFYCRDSAYFSVSASNKLSCKLTGQCFEIGNKNIPPIRYAQGLKRENLYLTENERQSKQ